MTRATRENFLGISKHVSILTASERGERQNSIEQTTQISIEICSFFFYLPCARRDEDRPLRNKKLSRTRDCGMLLVLFVLNSCLSTAVSFVFAVNADEEAPLLEEYPYWRSSFRRTYQKFPEWSEKAHSIKKLPVARDWCRRKIHSRRLRLV